MDLNNKLNVGWAERTFGMSSSTPNSVTIIRCTKDAVKIQGSDPLPDRCPLYPRIMKMLLGVTSPDLATRIGAAQDVEERMLRWSERMEPRTVMSLAKVSRPNEVGKGMVQCMAAGRKRIRSHRCYW